MKFLLPPSLHIVTRRLPNAATIFVPHFVGEWRGAPREFESVTEKHSCLRSIRGAEGKCSVFPLPFLLLLFLQGFSSVRSSVSMACYHYSPTNSGAVRCLFPQRWEQRWSAGKKYKRRKEIFYGYLGKGRKEQQAVINDRC